MLFHLAAVLILSCSVPPKTWCSTRQYVPCSSTWLQSSYSLAVYLPKLGVPRANMCHALPLGCSPHTLLQCPSQNLVFHAPICAMLFHLAAVLILSCSVPPKTWCSTR